MDGFNFGQVLENTVGRIFDFLPQLIAAIVILIIGYFVAKLLEKLIRGILHKLRFDEAVARTGAARYVSQVIDEPTGFTGRVVYWLVFIGFISLAVSALNLPLLNDLVATVYGYLPSVIAAIIIFLVASVVSAGSSAFALRILGSGSPIARVVTVIIPSVTMSIAFFMILNQLGIARDIVNITYTAIVGSLALGLALAFGLGGRDAAARLLDKAMDTAENNKDRVVADANRGKENVKSEVERLRNKRR